MIEYMPYICISIWIAVLFLIISVIGTRIDNHEEKIRLLEAENKAIRKQVVELCKKVYPKTNDSGNPLDWM